ncbi:MAG: amidohydrolase family protein [bacterium]|nr:amidohydrolase family protein [bacterium]
MRRTLALIFGSLFVSTVGHAAATAYVGVTVHPVSSAAMESATLLVEDGKIAGIGTDLEIPSDAAVVDLAGLHLYPGFVHPLSVLGLTEINSVRGTRDYTEIGEVNADIRAEVAFNADSELLPVAMSGGILTAHVVPTGGIFRGTSAAVRLEGWNWEDMTMSSSVGMHVEYPDLRPPAPSFRVPKPPSEDEVKKKKEETLKTINDTLKDARAYAKAVAAAAEGSAPAPTHDAKLAALGPMLAGEMPLFLYADERTQIESALDWADEQELSNIVLVTGPDAVYLADRLAESDVRVLLNGVHKLPERDWEPYDTPFTAAKRLHDAGVEFCIGDGGGGFRAPHVRNLPFHAAMAAAFGLPKEVALRSVTLSAAEFLGIQDRVGSLEVGKDATFIATSGDPLEVKTRILRAWIAGDEIDFSLDRQKRLYRKYDNRPQPRDERSPDVEGIREQGKG